MDVVHAQALYYRRRLRPVKLPDRGEDPMPGFRLLAPDPLGNDELRISYPVAWEEEYRATGRVARWSQMYPDLFDPAPLISSLGSLDLFAQYALQALLREREGITRLTWYKLASTSPTSRNRARTDAHWRTMRAVMGTDFDRLQEAILAAGFVHFNGEPDLFCWQPVSGDWFFAEAKRRDQLSDSQRRWFQVCRDVLGDRGAVRVCRLVPERARPGLSM
jgi:hypothetical protein